MNNYSLKVLLLTVFGVLLVASATCLASSPEPIGMKSFVPWAENKRSETDKKQDLMNMHMLLWDKKTLNIDASALSKKRRLQLKEVADYLNSVSCVKFRLKFPKSETYKLRVATDKKVCRSVHGYGQTPQNLRLGDHCFDDYGRVYRVLLKAANIRPEHRREDRDHFVRVDWSSVLSFVDMLFYYSPYDRHYGYLMSMGLPYDYWSIAHDAGHKYKLKFTMPSVFYYQGDFPYPLGQRFAPSRADIARLNRMYECFDHYLGDDIPNAVPYKLWHKEYMDKSKGSDDVKIKPDPNQPAKKRRMLVVVESKKK